MANLINDQKEIIRRRNKNLEGVEKIIIKPVHTQYVEKEPDKDIQKIVDQKKKEVTDLEKKIADLKLKIKNQSNEIIENAKKEAEAIIANANEEAQQKINETAEQAYNQGFQQGVDNAMAICSETMENTQNVLVQIEEQKKNVMHQAEKQLLQLSIAIAEKIINCHISLHQDHILLVLQEVIDHVTEKENLKIYINENSIKRVQDFKKFIVEDPSKELTEEENAYNETYKDMMNSFQDELVGLIKKLDRYKIIEDNTIQDGGCIIETNIENIDATIESKLNDLKEKLLKAFTDIVIEENKENSKNTEEQNGN